MKPVKKAGIKYVIPEDAMIARRDERIKKMLGGTKKVMKGGALTYDQVVLISALTGVSVAAIYTLLQGNNQVAPQPDVPISQISIPHLFGQADPQLDNLEAGGRYIQPINHKPSEKYCCGAGTPPNMMYRPF